METEALEKRIEELERRVAELERTCLRLMQQPSRQPKIQTPTVVKGAPLNAGPQIFPYLPSMQITSQ